MTANSGIRIRSRRWPRIVPVDTIRRLLRHKLSAIGSAYIVLVAFVAIFAAPLSPYDPLGVDPINARAKPTVSHPIGTDHVGRDQFSRLLYGSRISIIVGISAAVLGALIGVPLGLVGAHFGGWTDHLVMRVVDAKMAIPGILLAMLLLLLLGGGVFTVSLALGLNLSSTQARLVRSQALSVKEREYFAAGRAMGMSTWRLLFVHLMPNSIQPVIVQASLGVGFAVLGEASLSFLGVGVTPPTPTWGNMLNMAFESLSSAPWLSFAPGIAIFLLVLAFSFLGDGLRDVLDPRLRGKP